MNPELTAKSRIRKRLHGNVISYLALFAALTGTAWAGGLVGAKDIRENAVRSKHIKAGHVRGSDVADDGLTGADIDESTLEAGGGAPSGPAGGDLAGSYPNPSIGFSKVSSIKVLDNSLSGADIVEGSLDLDLQIVEVESATNGDSPKFATAVCPSGKRPVGAGAHMTGGTSGSAPNAASSVVIDELSPFATGVGASAFEIAGGSAGNWSVTAVAICARLAG